MTPDAPNAATVTAKPAAKAATHVPAPGRSAGADTHPDPAPRAPADALTRDGSVSDAVWAGMVEYASWLPHRH